MNNIELIVVRLKAGLKQYELAEELGIPAPYLSEMETGRRPITPEIYKEIQRLTNGKAIFAKC